jgi:hypothetical protein
MKTKMAPGAALSHGSGSQVRPFRALPGAACFYVWYKFRRRQQGLSPRPALCPCSPEDS